jgi:hypothetical protein
MHILTVLEIYNSGRGSNQRAQRKTLDIDYILHDQPHLMIYDVTLG